MAAPTNSIAHGSGVTTPHRVVAVRYAERETTRSEVYYRWSTYGEPDGPLRLAYYFWVLDPPAGPPVVVDCGFRVDEGARRGRPCSIEPAAALTRLGIDPASVKQVVLTHLHYDHIGNVDLFPSALLVIARREQDFWTGLLAARPHFAEHTDPGAVAVVARAAAAGQVRFVEDELEVTPGIVALRVGGHCPGQLIVAVDTIAGGVLLASDALHYYDELATERPFAVFANLPDVYHAYDTIRALTATSRVLVPGHDPLVMERHPDLDATWPGLGVRIA
jgi:glyoxylase-like metal-dependent hydrolase (beta-lactamase superfamily II)